MGDKNLKVILSDKFVVSEGGGEKGRGVVMWER